MHRNIPPRALGKWSKARPKPSRLALEVGKWLKLCVLEPFEWALVRLRLEYRKRGRCGACPVRGYCRRTKKFEDSIPQMR